MHEADDGLECGHWFCNACLLNRLAEATNGLYITNSNEPSQPLTCPKCAAPASTFDIMLILGELY